MTITLTNFMDDSQLMTVAPACQDTMTRILADCDGNDLVNNPNNSKFGFNILRLMVGTLCLRPKHIGLLQTKRIPVTFRTNSSLTRLRFAARILMQIPWEKMGRI